MRFSKMIEKIQDLKAYYVGDKLNVEVDIILDEGTSLRDGHDVGESLQYILESVPTVDRVFVYLESLEFAEPPWVSKSREDLLAQACLFKEGLIGGFKPDFSIEFSLEFNADTRAVFIEFDAELKTELNTEISAEFGAESNSGFDSGFDAGFDTSFDTEFDIGFDIWVDIWLDRSSKASQGVSKVGTHRHSPLRH